MSSQLLLIAVLYTWSALATYLENKAVRLRFSAGQIPGQVLFVCTVFSAASVSSILATFLLSAQLCWLYINILHIRFFGSSIRASELLHFWSKRSHASEYSSIIKNSLRTLGRWNDLSLLPPFLALIAVVVWASGYERERTVIVSCLVIGITCLVIDRFWTARKGSFMTLMLELSGQPKTDNTDRALALPANEINSSSPWFGKLKGKNLILLQLESFQQFLIGHTINGVEVTPFLNRMAREGVYFSNIYSQYGMGHTADVELAVLQSLYPQRDEIANYQHFSKQFDGLPSILKEAGYFTVAYHGFSGDGYNRRTMFKAFGFDQFLAREDLQSSDVLGFGISDESFLTQVAEHMATLPQPYFAFPITLTSHYPYVLPDEEKRLNTEGVSEDLSNYFHCVNYTDRALGLFLDELKSRGIHDNSAIVLYGDHEGVVHKNIPELAKHLGMPEEPETGFLSSKLAKIPLIIHSGIASAAPYASDVIGSAMDIGQTALHLLGLAPIRYGFGTQLFDASADRIIPLSGHLPGSYASRNEILLASEDGGAAVMDMSERRITAATAAALARKKEAEKQIRSARHMLQNDMLGSKKARNVQRIELAPHVQEFLSMTSFREKALLIPFAHGIELNHIDAMNQDVEAVQQFLDQASSDLPVRLALMTNLDIKKNKLPVYFAYSDHLAAFRAAGYSVEAITGTHISDYFRSIPDHALVAIVCFDEGSAAITDDMAKELRIYGIRQLDKGKFRHAYVNLLYKNTGFVSLLEEVSLQPIDITLAAGDIKRGIVVPCHLRLVSAGSDGCSPAAQIIVDGVSSIAPARGLNIVVIDIDTATCISSIQIDTYATLFAANAIHVARPKSA